jgi:predicted ATPase
MIKSVEFKVDWRTFKAGDRFEFTPGINLLVGDQGAGKSSLITLFKWALNDNKEFERIAHISVEGKIQLRLFDFEADNPRTRSYCQHAADVYMRFQAHGNCVLAILDVLGEEIDTVKAFVLDEPDMALSIRSINKLVGILKSTKHQVISSAHNPLLIQSFDNVLSIEHKKWMKSKEFIESQMTDGEEAQTDSKT